MSRPAETLTAALGALIAALVAVLAAFDVDVPEAWITAAIAVVGFVAPIVTWYVARRQRDPAGALSSGADGTVVKA